MRVSTRTVRVSPTRSNSCSCNTRSSLTCRCDETLLISSRKIVPVWAASNRPVRFSEALVNAPFTCPNSSLSSRLSASAPQFTRINGPLRRFAQVVHRPGDQFLAVLPVSPVSSTVPEERATRRVRS